MASSALSCTICYESYVESTDICSTKCGHIFHLSCIQKWITQSNTCPMCNVSYPQPHRIYLDIDGINETVVSNSTQENNGRENTVVVKGVKPNQVTTPLYSLVQRLIAVMQVAITDEDIKDIKNVSKGGRRGFVLIHVTFKMKHHMDLFLKQKHKLKKNPEMSQIRINELLNPETEALFQYTHKLKNADYKIIYVENQKVYVKKNQNSQPIYILTRNQVDELCLQHANHREIASTSMAQRNNEVRSTNTQHTNHREIASTSMAQRNVEVHSTNSSETLELYQYSLKLEPSGYYVFLNNNEVFAKNLLTLNQYLISSRNIVDRLLFNSATVQYDRNRSPIVSNNQYRNTNKNNDTCNIL